MDSSLIITVDGLNARFLGAYGNSWIPTPAVNHLASKGTLFENFIANSDDPNKNLTAMLTGIHPLLGGNSTSQKQDPQLQPSHRILVTDDPDIDRSVGHFFDQSVLVAMGTTDDPEPTDSALERIFSGALDILLETIQTLDSDTDFQFWIHSKGFYGDWDAPLDFQQLFKDETDPEPIHVEQAPAKTLDDDFDPDEKLVWVHAYAAMIVRLDQCLEWLFSALDSLPIEPTILLAGIRGFPLGEHLEIGKTANSYLAEHTHIPLIKSNLDRLPRRVNRLVDTCDFQGVVSESIDSAARNSPYSELVVSASNRFARIQTPAWSYTNRLADSELKLQQDQTAMLFAKPSDLLELNEVSDVCPEIAQIFKSELERQLLSFAKGETPSEASLDSAIFKGLA